MPKPKQPVSGEFRCTAPRPYGMLRDPYGMLRDPYGMLRDPYGMLRDPYGMLRDPYGMLREGALYLPQPLEKAKRPVAAFRH